MKLIFDKPLGIGNPYSPSQKCIWSTIIGAGASLLGNWLGNEQQAGYTKEQQKLQSKLNREEMEHSMNLQKNYQNMLWNQGAARQVNGMKNAGLNPAMVGGTALGGASGSGGVAKPSSGASGPAGSPGTKLGSEAVASAMNVQQTQSNVELNKSQADLNEANAEYLKSKTTGQNNINSKFEETYLRDAKEQEARTKAYGEQAYASHQQGMLFGEQAKSEQKRQLLLENQAKEAYAAAQLAYAKCDEVRSIIQKNFTERYVMLSRLRQEIMNGMASRLKMKSETFKNYADTYANMCLAESKVMRDEWEEKLAKQELEFNEKYGRWIQRFKVVRGFSGLASDVVVSFIGGKYVGKLMDKFSGKK